VLAEFMPLFIAAPTTISLTTVLLHNDYYLWTRDKHVIFLKKYSIVAQWLLFMNTGQTRDFPEKVINIMSILHLSGHALL